MIYKNRRAVDGVSKDKQSRRTTAAALVETLYSETKKPATAVEPHRIHQGHYVDGVGMPTRLGVLSRLLRNMAASIVASWDRRVAADQLSRMSDRDLADIGLSREQLPRALDLGFTQGEGELGGSVSRAQGLRLSRFL